MAKRAKRKCTRYKRVKELQSFGPAKTRRVCASYGGGKSGRKKSHWCVFKGKAKIATSCHLTKAAASKARTRLRKTCKRRVRVKKVLKRS